MRVTITGGTGLIGRRVVRELLRRGDEVTVLSRDPGRAASALGPDVIAHAWDPDSEPAPAEALAGRDGVVHLAGENLAQRWTSAAKERIMRSRRLGTRNLVAGLRAADPGPSVLVSASAVGYYGVHGDEVLDESAPPGDDFLADVVVAWEQEAEAAAALGTRVVRLRAGVVLDAGGGALAKMLPFFKAGIGGPVAGGRQYLSWIDLDDEVALIVRALTDDSFEGAVNATSPEPVTNAEFSKALGRALNRPALAPVPRLAIRALYGEMATLVADGQRVVPRRALGLGFEFERPDIDEALRAALARG